MRLAARFVLVFAGARLLGLVADDFPVWVQVMLVVSYVWAGLSFIDDALRREIYRGDNIGGP